MSGLNAFNDIVNLTTLPSSRHSTISITTEQFEQWKKQYTVDGLRGTRYGESFCKYFNITDYVLYYSLTPEQADTYITETYFERS